MKRIRPSRNRVRQTGSSLFEVMIAVLVLSTGMLGVAAMQAISLRNSQSAFQRSQAILLAYSITEAMRANVEAARISPGYTLALPATGCSVPLAGSTLISNDLNAWVSAIQTTMGAGACGGISCTSGVCEVSIRWNDEGGSGGSAAQELHTRSLL
ncbi:MAG: type IV pilus modification protein PilV [Xanthomonadales bacterium]|nr:type IV pilus modification protein PilV [Xanthomonadales bacterium]